MRLVSRNHSPSSHDRMCVYRCEFGPATLEPPHDQSRTSIKHICPVTYRSGNPVCRNEVGGSPIASLLRLSGPLAVFGFVVSVVVDSVYGIPCDWTRSHVGKKCFKPTRTSPPLANGDSASSVTIKMIEAWVTASLIHPNPDSIFGRVRLSMSGPGAIQLCKIATARSTQATGQTTFNNYPLRSAITHAQIGMIVPNLTRVSQHDPSTESASNVQVCHVGNDSMNRQSRKVSMFGAIRELAEAA
jgi:hypothetical protein